MVKISNCSSCREIARFSAGLTRRRPAVSKSSKSSRLQSDTVGTHSNCDNTAYSLLKIRSLGWNGGWKLSGDISRLLFSDIYELVAIGVRFRALAALFRGIHWSRALDSSITYLMNWRNQSPPGDALHFRSINFHKITLPALSSSRKSLTMISDYHKLFRFLRKKNKFLRISGSSRGCRRCRGVKMFSRCSRECWVKSLSLPTYIPRAPPFLSHNWSRALHKPHCLPNRALFCSHFTTFSLPMTTTLSKR